MGTPIPPNEPANNCAQCWGPGKAFGDFPTPRFMSVELTKFLPGEFWLPEYELLLLTTHDLVQLGPPCQWQVVAPPFQWFLNYAPGFTFFMVAHTPTGKLAFFEPNAPDCAIDFPSSLVAPNNRIAYGGFANITWNPEDLD